jgi:hypothetical protein
MNSLARDAWCSPAHVLALGRASFVADPTGALYWPQERLLAVADLHLEKGSAFAARRMFLPPYDTATTLAALAVLVARYAPRGVLALGDSFHDVGGSARLGVQDRAALARLQSGRDWIWIAGNHDPFLPADLGGARHAEIAIGGIMFRHRPEAAGDAEIAGHFHPMARVAGAIGSVRRRCFVSNGVRCVLPAFGAYAGGLNLHDRAFAALFGRGGAAVFAHVLGRERVYRVAQEQCLPD